MIDIKNNRKINKDMNILIESHTTDNENEEIKSQASGVSQITHLN